MPQVEVTTKQAEQIWASPDGQRVIYKVLLDYQGSELGAKTYSKAIATVGWQGTVESYEKQGQRGTETFVKQPPKEGGFQSSGNSGSKPAYVPRDDSHIKAQWAIGQAVSVLASGGELDLENTELLAKDLFNMIDRVKTAPVEPVENTIDTSVVEKIFAEPVPVDNKELPWNPAG